MSESLGHAMAEVFLWPLYNSSLVCGHINVKGSRSFENFKRDQELASERIKSSCHCE